MRSRLAVGDRSLLHRENRIWLKQLLPKTARRFAVRLYATSNNGNHLHLVVKTKERENLSRFLRVLSGVIARKALKAEKGRPVHRKFWDSRPYSRVITWGREFWNVLRYVERNILEASGKLVYRSRGTLEAPLTQVYLAQRTYLNQRDLRAHLDPGKI